jgi:hypothetical protein
MESSEDIYQNRTNAIEPVYKTSQPNQPIQIYSGDLEINQEENLYQGNGGIEFKWLPYPHIYFDFFTIDTPPYKIKTKEKINLKFLENEVVAEGYISSMPSEPWGVISSDYKHKIAGTLESVVLGSCQNLSYIIFHLTNFFDFGESFISKPGHKWLGRLSLEADGWKINIDSLENISSIINTLESKGGYAITHVGKIERDDNKPFNLEDAKDTLEALRWFLTFARGFWITPIFLVGYDSEGNKILQGWGDNQIIAPWREVYSWFPNLKSYQSFDQLFSGFLHRWKNPIWNETIRLSIHWYLESIALAGAVQGSIVLMQTAFELLAWTLLVEDKKIMSMDGCEKLPAADKLRLLLSQCGISLKIPESLTNLLKVAKEYNWVDGGQALTEIRNAIVHSNPKKRTRILNRPFSEQIDTYNLGLWYLELILLHLFDYKGKYFNRVANKDFYNDNIESVPWVKN